MLRVLLLLLFMVEPASAQEGIAQKLFSVVPPSEFVDAFVGLCISNPGRLDKVAATAQVLEYGDLPDDIALMLAPQAPDANFKGWLSLKGIGSPFILGISEGPFNDKTYQFCALSNPYISADAIMPRTIELLALGDQDIDETTAGQRMRSWLVPNIHEDGFLSINDISGMGYAGVTISFSAPRQY
jgi:hypothetical protein